MAQRIRKAIFPVAGLGTRFLPVTKANPKEMLPIVDKPLIQYAVEEAVAAGITDLIFVTGRTKRSIADHFDKAYELENELQKQNKIEMLELVQNILPSNVTCIHIRQAEPLGLGHAVLCGRAAVGDEPFAVLLADDLIDDGDQGCLKQMVDVFENHQRSVIAVENIPKEETDKYGIVSTDAINDQIGKINGIVEKPEPSKAPSTQAVVGRYILTPEIFNLLENTGAGAAGEIQLTDAIAELLKKEEVYSLAFAGKRYDCGSKLGYLQATVEYALKHPELKEEFSNYLQGKEYL
jgi:UTP--glucose-1-phosphate uridylyltransferase